MVTANTKAFQVLLISMDSYSAKKNWQVNNVVERDSSLSSYIPTLYCSSLGQFEICELRKNDTLPNYALHLTCSMICTKPFWSFGSISVVIKTPIRLCMMAFTDALEAIAHFCSGRRNNEIYQSTKTERGGQMKYAFLTYAASRQGDYLEDAENAILCFVSKNTY